MHANHELIMHGIKMHADNELIMHANHELIMQVELFARPDAEFMAMFTAPGVLDAMNKRLDSLQKRVDSLLKLKNEFQELARVL